MAKRGAYAEVWKQQMAKVHRFPDGWDTPESVAVELACSVDRLPKVVAPCIKTGAIERREFRVWDGEKIVRRTGYRIVSRPRGKAATA